MAQKIPPERTEYRPYVRVDLGALEHIQRILEDLMSKPNDLNVTTDEWEGSSLFDVLKEEKRPQVREFAMWVTEPFVAVDFKRGEPAKLQNRSANDSKAVGAFERIDRILRENQINRIARMMRSIAGVGAALVLTVSLVVVAGWNVLNGRVAAGVVICLVAVGSGALFEWLRRARLGQYRVQLVYVTSKSGFLKRNSDQLVRELFAVAFGVGLTALVTLFLK